jgi:LPXTG-site transpeptidase (sortase) family protein
LTFDEYAEHHKHHTHDKPMKTSSTTKGLMKLTANSTRRVTAKVPGVAMALFLVLGFSSPSGASWLGPNVPTSLQGSPTLNGGGALLHSNLLATPTLRRSYHSANAITRLTASVQAQRVTATSSVDQLMAALGGASQPSRITIPSISVDAKIVPVGIDPATKSLVVPAQGSVVGWFSRGAKQRPTVLVGHVDTAKKAAVFYRLPKLRTGDSIRVINSDETVRRYRVERITRVGKNSFPTKSVYLGSGLRLITCGGKFDRKTGHYEDNIIVFAKAI